MQPNVPPAADQRGPLAVGRPGGGPGRRHRLVGLTITGSIVAFVGLGWTTSTSFDAVVVRLWLLLALIVTVVAAVTTGFDHRYPDAGFGSVALRLAGLAAGLSLGLFVVADAFVFGHLRFAEPGPLAAFVLLCIVPVIWSLLSARRAIRQGPDLSAPTPSGRASPSAQPSTSERRRTVGVTALAAAIVAVPVAGGALLIALLAGLCGSDGAVLWLLAALGAPIVVVSAELGFQRRWPRSGLAVSIGRLTVVGVGLLLLTGGIASALSDGERCESTLGTSGQAPAATVLDML